MSSAKAYAITVEFKNPSAGQTDGSPLIVYGNNAAEAIKAARKEMRNRGHDRWDGPVTYRARIATPDEIADHLSSGGY